MGVQMMKMMQIMNKYKQSHHDSHDYSSYSGYNKKSDSFAPIMEYMMKNKMDHHQSYNNEYAMKDESQPWMEKMKMMMLMKKMMSGEQDMRRENPFEDMDNKYQKMASLMHHFRSKRQTARQGDALALN